MNLLKKWRGTKKFDTFYVGQYGRKNYMYTLFEVVVYGKVLGLSFKNRSLTMLQVFFMLLRIIAGGRN